MKNKSEIFAFLLFVGLLYVEFHSITPDSHSALTSLADINWEYLCLVIGIALIISLLALSYIHDILFFLKIEKDGDITYSFVVALAIFGVFWSLSKRVLKSNRKQDKNPNKN